MKGEHSCSPFFTCLNPELLDMFEQPFRPFAGSQHFPFFQRTFRAFHKERLWFYNKVAALSLEVLGDSPGGIAEDTHPLCRYPGIEGGDLPAIDNFLHRCKNHTSEGP